MNRFEMGIKEIFRRSFFEVSAFSRVEMTVHWGCYRRATRDESTTSRMSFRRTCSEKSVKINFLLML
jgi:hypothetical protein